MSDSFNCEFFDFQDYSDESLPFFNTSSDESSSFFSDSSEDKANGFVEGPSKSEQSDDPTVFPKCNNQSPPIFNFSQTISSFHNFFDVHVQSPQLKGTLSAKKRKNYGLGKESLKLKKYNHYKEDYTQHEIYKKLGNPTKQKIISIGQSYNYAFGDQIKSGKLPKFKRDHTRNMSVAIGLFVDNLHLIESWLSFYYVF